MPMATTLSSSTNCLGLFRLVGQAGLQLLGKPASTDKAVKWIRLAATTSRTRGRSVASRRRSFPGNGSRWRYGLNHSLLLIFLMSVLSLLRQARHVSMHKAEILYHPSRDFK